MLHTSANLVLLLTCTSYWRISPRAYAKVDLVCMPQKHLPIQQSREYKRFKQLSVYLVDVKTFRLGVLFICRIDSTSSKSFQMGDLQNLMIGNTIGLLCSEEYLIQKYWKPPENNLRTPWNCSEISLEISLKTPENPLKSIWEPWNPSEFHLKYPWIPRFSSDCIVNSIWNLEWNSFQNLDSETCNVETLLQHNETYAL